MSSVSYSEHVRLVMSGKSVTYLKAHLQAWDLGTRCCLSAFCLIKKRPGVCKHMVGASAHPDSLTFWLFKPLMLSHGAWVMNVSSPPSTGSLDFSPSPFYSSFERVESQWQLAAGKPVVWEAEGISDTEIHMLPRLYLDIIHITEGPCLQLLVWSWLAVARLCTVLHCGAKWKSLQWELMHYLLSDVPIKFKKYIFTWLVNSNAC